MKKNYFSTADLSVNAPVVSSQLVLLDRNLRPPEFVASYILTWIRHTDLKWNMGPVQDPLRFYFDHEDLNVFARFRIRKISHHINRVLTRWALGHFQLHLSFDPLTPIQVLEFQCLGQRCVTCVLPPTKMDEYVLGERDPLSFCTHDLMHAHHFFSEPSLLDAQIGFSRMMKAVIDEEVFNPLYESPQFRERFEYAYSDMNGHPVHLLKYLRAIVDETRNYGFDSEKFWGQLVEVCESRGLTAHHLFQLNREENPDDLLNLTKNLEPIADLTDSSFLNAEATSQSL